MKVLAAMALCLFSSTALAADFEDARILDFGRASKLSEQILGNGIGVDDYSVLVVRLGELKITARTYQLGGGTVYVAAHPLAFVVGTKIKAKVDKRGSMLEVLVPGRKQPLKFQIQRAEKAD